MTQTDDRSIAQRDGQIAQIRRLRVAMMNASNINSCRSWLVNVTRTRKLCYRKDDRAMRAI